MATNTLPFAPAKKRLRGEKARAERLCQLCEPIEEQVKGLVEFVDFGGLRVMLKPGETLTTVTDEADPREAAIKLLKGFAVRCANAVLALERGAK